MCLHTCLHACAPAFLGEYLYRYHIYVHGVSLSLFLSFSTVSMFNILPSSLSFGMELPIYVPTYLQNHHEVGAETSKICFPFFSLTAPHPLRSALFTERMRNLNEVVYFGLFCETL